MNLQITIQTPTKKKNISHSEQDVWTEELYQTNNKGAVERGLRSIEISLGRYLWN